MVTTSNTKGLVERLREAKSRTQIEELLAAGAKYEYASDRTRNRWKAVAELRLKELSSGR